MKRIAAAGLAAAFSVGALWFIGWPPAGEITARAPVGAIGRTWSRQAPDPPRTVVVTAAGDICTSIESCRPTARLIRRIGPDVALTTGDNQYPSGELSDYREVFARTWGRFKRIIRPSAGNHEWRTPGASGYLEYFGLDSFWYGFDAGAWRLISLDGTCSENGGCDEGSPQYEWLAADLAADPHACTLAYWHEPRFSSGTTHGSATSVEPLWSLLSAAGAELVLNGHEHNYERFAPQDASGNADPTGIVEIVAGTGGNGEASYPFGPPIAGSRVRLNGIGVVRLTLRPNGWTSRFVRPGGEVSDRARGSCDG